MKLCTFSKRAKIRGLHEGDISPCYYVLRYAIAYLNVSFRKYNSKRKERGMAVKYENKVCFRGREFEFCHAMLVRV